MKLFSYIYRDCDILPHFFSHYDALESLEYHFIVNTRNAPELKARVEAYCANKKAHLNFIDRVFLSDEKDAALDELKRLRADPDEWVMMVDLDEFVEFKARLRTLVFFHELLGYDTVCGAFLDRVHPDGGVAADPAATVPERTVPLGGPI